MPLLYTLKMQYLELMNIALLETLICIFLAEWLCGFHPRKFMNNSLLELQQVGNVLQSDFPIGIRHLKLLEF